MLDFIKTLPTLDGIPILYSDSGPVLYNERGDWTFDEPTTVQEASGEMRTQTTLDRPFGATPNALRQHSAVPGPVQGGVLGFNKVTVSPPKLLVC